MNEQLNLMSGREEFLGLTEEERAVWIEVRYRRGRNGAISVKGLMQRTGFSDTQVRSTISELVRHHGKLIGSSTSAPAGFYIIVNQKELDEHIRSLKSRGIMCFVRAAALARTSIEDIFGQAKLELYGDDK